MSTCHVYLVTRPCFAALSNNHRPTHLLAGEDLLCQNWAGPALAPSSKPRHVPRQGTHFQSVMSRGGGRANLKIWKQVLLPPPDIPLGRQVERLRYAHGQSSTFLLCEVPLGQAPCGSAVYGKVDEMSPAPPPGTPPSPPILRLYKAVHPGRARHSATEFKVYT